MAKYVFDFDKIKSTISELNTEIENVEASINTYNSTINSDLANWTGIAKNAFIKSLDSQVDQLNAKIEMYKSFVEYLNKIYTTMEETENELASLEI